MDRAASEGGDAPYLVTTSLSKHFGAFRALSDISFSIARGEFICFLGPSGCGKTTLLRCIAGLETQSDGSIRADGGTSPGCRLRNAISESSSSPTPCSRT